jgi:hypothetical protein
LSAGKLFYFYFQKTDELYKSLQKLPHTKVYKKEDIPDQLNFKRNDRIAPLVAITDEGYVLNCCSAPANPLSGNHGFNNSIISMRAIFLGRIVVHHNFFTSCFFTLHFLA